MLLKWSTLKITCLKLKPFTYHWQPGLKHLEIIIAINLFKDRHNLTAEGDLSGALNCVWPRLSILKVNTYMSHCVIIASLSILRLADLNSKWLVNDGFWWQHSSEKSPTIPSLILISQMYHSSTSEKSTEHSDFRGNAKAFFTATTVSEHSRT